MKRITPWLVCAAFLLLRWTCRVRFHNDPRSDLRRTGRNYVFAAMHAHQIAALLVSEPESGVMVSRSADGGIMVPVIRLSGCRPVRGSGGKPRKGGSRAMHQMIRHVRGGRPAALTVDGPLGPRGRVHPGILMLAEKTGAKIIPVSVLPTRRIVLQKTWDRFQLPLPGATIDVRFGPPLAPRHGEPLEAAAERLERRLEMLDRRWDPTQAEPTRGDEGHAVCDTPRSRCA